MGRNIGTPIIIEENKKTKTSQIQNKNNRNIGSPIILTDNFAPLKELLPPKNASPKATAEYVNKYVAGQTLQKMENNEYVTPTQIDGAVKYFKGQKNTGWAAMNNPSFANINGDEIATQLSGKKDYYSLFKNKDDYKKRKTDVDNQIKYYDYNFKELRDARLKLEEERDNTKDQKKKKSLQKEIDWLENYSVTKEYDTVTDYENAIKSIKSEIGWYENDLAWRRKEGTADEVEEKYSKKIKQLEGQIEVLKTGINKASRKKYLYDNYYHLPEEEDFERRVNDINRIQRDISLKRAGIATPKSTDYSMSYLLKNNKINNEKSGIVSSYDYLNIPEDMKNLWLQTTTEEKNICAYLYSGKGGRKAVLDFLEEIKPELSQRDEEWWLKRHINEYVNGDTWQKVKMNLYSIPQSVFGNISAGAEDIISLVKTGNVNPYSSGHRLQNIASTTRQLTANEIDESIDSDFLSELAVSSYQGAMSAGDMALGGLLLGESGYITSMGLGAFSSKARSLYERGADTSEILLGATLSAVLEVGTEKIGVDRFMKTLGSKTGKEWIKKILVQFGAEPSEELVSKIGNLVIDDLVMGQNSEMQNKIREYISQGMSKDEATKKANTEFVKETFWEMYSALISVGGTGLVSGSFYGIKKVQTQKAINQTAKGIVSKNNVDVLLDLSKTLPADSKVYKFAKSFTEADKKSTSKVSKLYSNFITDINGQIEAKTKNAISARLTELGGVRNANKTADIIYRMARMEENVEEYEKRSVLKNESANTVYAELTSEKSKTAEWVQNLANDTQQLSEIRNVVAISGNVTNQTLNTVINQLQVSSNSQKPTLQSSAEVGAEGVQFEGVPELTEAEQQILNTPDNELTPEQRAVKKNLTERLQSSTKNDIINNKNHTESRFSPEEKKAAILDYKSGTAYRINAMIRESMELDESDQRFIDTLNEALQELPTYQGEVYRNITFDDFGGQEAFEAFLEQHHIDKLVFYNQFTSCSTKVDGYPVEGDYKVHLVIKSINARNVDGYGNNMESEVIFPTDSVFLVTDVDNNGNQPTIYLQEVIINEKQTTMERGDAVRDMQKLYFENHNLQSVSGRNTAGDTVREIRPQSSPSERQRDNVRSGRGQETLLSTSSQEQVNISNTKATSDNGAASFLPESDSSFTEYSAKSPEPDAVKDYFFEAKGVQRLTYEQQKITDIGRKFGYKVKFVKMDSKNGVVENGQIDKTNRVIYINTEAKRPIQFIIKHELTHYLEINKEKYFDLANKIMDSDLFKNFIKSKGYNSISEYNSAIVDLYSKYDKKFGEADANLEMVADFCAEYLFGGEESLDRFIQSFNAKQRPAVIQAILDFIAYLKEKLSGNKEFNLDLVKLERKYMQLLKETSEMSDTSAEGVQHSFAKATDKNLIAKAEEMERSGKSEKAIWKKQGLIRDNGGVWVYEIADDEMEFFPDGDALVKDDPDYKEFLKLDSKNIWSDKDAERYAELDDKLLIKYDYGIPRLKSFITHNELFQKYPQLKEVELQFADLTRENMLGCYIHSVNKIVLDESLLKNDDNNYELKSVLIHEIQHAIQHIDNREEGSNVEFWNARLLNGKRMPKNPKTNEDYSPEEAYYFTAGEIESRETERRFDFSADARRYGYVPNFKRNMAVKQSEYQNDLVTVPSNSEYGQAVKNNDTKALQQMVDTAAMANGYTERLYHQTDADFTEFNTENQRAGKYDFELPAGTFLKPSNEDIGLKGKKQMELYARLQNPLEFKDREEARSFWKENVEGYKQAVEEVLKIDEEYRARTDEAMNNVRNFSKEWKQNNPEANNRKLYANVEYQKLMDIQDSIVDEWEEKSNEASLKAKELINGFISQNDYDGIIVENDVDGANKSTKTYIVFDSSQLKSAEAVTYDDSGEVIPLSERFDTEQADIRRSLSSVTSDESLLESYENGDITREEYLSALKKQKTLNPVEIANLTEEDASTTPHHQRKRGKSDGDGTSKFYGSLLESSIFDDTFKDEVKEDSFIEKYKTISNKETMRKAANELDAGGQSYVNEWWKKEPDEASLIDIAVGFILMDRYQRVGDYESAVAAAEQVRKFGTASGQQVQIFSIIGRLDPNSMQAYSQLTLDKAFRKLADVKTQQWIDKNAEKFKLTEDDIFYIRSRTLQAAMFEDNTRPKAILLAEICTRIQNKIPAEKGESIRALQRSSMLLNLKTNIRNIGGNAGMVPTFIASDFFGSMIDKKISKKTGVRTTGNFKLKGSGTALKKGLYESWDDFKRGIRTKQEELNRFDIAVTAGKNFNELHNGKFAKQLNAIAKTLNKIDNFTSFCLEAGDRPFFEMWLTNSINNQLRLNNVDIPTPEMLEIARQEALQRTWQDDNMLTNSISKIKADLNKLHFKKSKRKNESAYGLGDVIFKFVKTPTNIAKAIVDFSPVGFGYAVSNAVELKDAIKKGKFTPQMQKEYVRSLSNAITGSLVYTLVALGASLGLIKLSGDEDDDKDASNYEKYIMGIPPYSIEFLGVNITYDWAQPFGSVLATVADFMESREANPEGDVLNAILEAIKAGGKAFTKQSFLQSLYDVFSSEDIVEALSTAALAEPAAFIPQRWSQTESFFDEYRRTSYNSTNGFKSAINKVIAKIPGLRTTLPKQVNILGEDIKNTQYLDVWEAFASPWNTYPKSSNEVVKEIYSLYKSTGENSVIPRTAPNYITVKGTKIEFSPEEKADFQRNIGTRSAKMLGQLFDNEEYNKLSDDEKVDVVKNIYQFAYDKAKSEREYNYKTLSAMVGEKKNGEPILTEEKYNKLPRKAKELLVQEYFLSKTEVKYIDIPEKLIQYYITQAKE